ncbi:MULTISPECIES: ROK family transcriptional regulator [unclassified Mesorhizobium]|uniref:ROK family transcriptional regulator n=1 Tax=unclassified Mesorhizobium TaxID=325217 RepID=UPI0010921625|nr:MULTISPECIES: ROK family transcriptional regulator [unclassified Mesorhizobium]TGV15096.1 ROK family transcriptional regulator [Mesorhizobium sp. M8A.F.Ca.ET.173.01.1.1]TGQ77235.1 ROK family transcriptional regulator [Mesorhizobium sp. M8A.F.Ca.ET.207.01.1.1]TGS38987.1 ROK family transcriptional regulator [Mesorhizobium sp. M8A.F.Ca.ET.182.01.1.1]TGS77268.1 ROK family transcriptional regulator [Mesorhizobium sp. M8A.F.Ca.ET.181.01.1.1]TGT36351.1 ROK family transcriptional regulator [Mesorhi
MKLKADQNTTRAMNRRLILNCLRREGDLSRVEIAAMTGLSPAAVTGVTAALIDEGIVLEGKSTQSSGGRRPIPLSIDYARHWSIGFKLTEGRLEGTLTDLSTRTIGACELPLPDHGPVAVAHAVKEGVATLMGDRREGRQKLVGIGMAMPGLVDVNRGVCLVSQRLGWWDVPIAEMIASQISVPVWVDNDVNAFAIAQQLFGHGRRRSSVLVLIIGTGVGAALIFNGQIHRGARSAAGEIGFPVKDGDDSIATQDRLNWDRRLSEPAMDSAWIEISKRSRKLPADLQQAIEAGERLALDYLSEVGREIGHRLSGLIDLIDPEVVIVGGEAVRFGPALIEPLIAAVRESSFATPPPIEIDWDNNVWSRGASALAIQKFFDFEGTAGFERESGARPTGNEPFTERRG